jgi:hypothetical protein
MTREPIYAALFARVAGAAGFTVTSRKLKHIADISKGGQPALYQVQAGERGEVQRGLPTKWTLSAELWISAIGTSSASPSQALNPLLDAVVTALTPNDPSNVLTLGGLVDHCWIAGQIEIHEGVLGDVALAVIPVDILTAA